MMSLELAKYKLKYEIEASEASKKEGGLTAVEYAVSKSRIEIMKLLIERNAIKNLEVLNRSRMIAQNCRQPKALALLDMLQPERGTGYYKLPRVCIGMECDQHSRELPLFPECKYPFCSNECYIVSILGGKDATRIPAYVSGKKFNERGHEIPAQLAIEDSCSPPHSVPRTSHLSMMSIEDAPPSPSPSLLLSSSSSLSSSVAAMALSGGGVTASSSSANSDAVATDSLVAPPTPPPASNELEVYVPDRTSIDTLYRDASGCSFLMNACRVGRKDCIELLIAHGADVNETTEKEGYTPIYFASLGGSRDCVELLLAHNARLIAGKDGMTPLMAAASGNHFKIAKILVEREDCDIKAKNKDGFSCVKLASGLGFIDFVKILIQKGAISTDNEMKSCRKYAEQMKKSNVGDLLKSCLQDKDTKIWYLPI